MQLNSILFVSGPVTLNACAATSCLVGSICVEENGVGKCVAPPNNRNNNCTVQFEEWKQCATCEPTCEKKNPVSSFLDGNKNDKTFIPKYVILFIIFYFTKYKIKENCRCATECASPLVACARKDSSETRRANVSRRTTAIPLRLGLIFDLCIIFLIQLTTPSTFTCTRPNEEYRECASACEPSCKNKDKEMVCLITWTSSQNSHSGVYRHVQTSRVSVQARILQR